MNTFDNNKINIWQQEIQESAVNRSYVVIAKA